MPDEIIVSRRSFLKGMGGGALAAVVTPAVLADKAAAAAGEKEITRAQIALRVNGRAYNVTVEPRHTLASVLRDKLDLTGTKVVCDRGECGSCTVLVDGKPVNSCMMLAIDAQGKELTTIEGLGRENQLHPVQEAFVEHDALMCGFCTPGFIMAVTACLREQPNPTPDQVRRAISGNVCRCGAYPRILQAALTAARTGAVNRQKGG